MITDTIQYCNEALENGENILVEGANATSMSYLSLLLLLLLLLL